MVDTKMDIPTAPALRDYQARAVSDIRASLARQRPSGGADNAPPSVVYQLPTGGGKTVIGAAVAAEVVRDGGRVVWLTHRMELLHQSVQAIRRTCPEAQVDALHRKRSFTWDRSRVVVGMVPTMHRRRRSEWGLPAADLVICDEVHHAASKTWRDMLAHYGEAARLGLSATPERLDGRGLRDQFRELITGPDIPTLQRDGHLAPVRMLRTAQLYDESQLTVLAGEFSGDSIRRAFYQDVGEMVTAPLTAYQRYAEGRQAIVFCPLLAHAELSRQSFEGAGIEAMVLSGQTSDRIRSKIVNSFRSGELRVLINCDVVSEGFDVPECGCVILCRPTRSLTVFLQQCGRASRPHEGRTALVLDCVGNYARHGHAADPRDWSLDGRGGRPRAPTPRACPHCDAVLPVRAVLTCPECGGPIPPPESRSPDPKPESDTMVEVPLNGYAPAPPPRKRRPKYADCYAAMLDAEDAEVMLRLAQDYCSATGAPPERAERMLREVGKLRKLGTPASAFAWCKQHAGPARHGGYPTKLRSRVQGIIQSQWEPGWHDELARMLDAELAGR